MIPPHQHTSSNILCNSCTTTLPPPLGDLQAHIVLDHRQNDNHQPQIALLASSASIELVSSSARVTSAKFHKAVVCREGGTPGPIDRTPETPGSGKNKAVQKRKTRKLQIQISLNLQKLVNICLQMKFIGLLTKSQTGPTFPETAKASE